MTRLLHCNRKVVVNVEVVLVHSSQLESVLYDRIVVGFDNPVSSRRKIISKPGNKNCLRTNDTFLLRKIKVNQLNYEKLSLSTNPPKLLQLHLPNQSEYIQPSFHNSVVCAQVIHLTIVLM